MPPKRVCQVLLARALLAALVTLSACVGLSVFLLLVPSTRSIRGLSGKIDAPFYEGCLVPNVSAPRANATILMLARNSDLDGAVHSIVALERHFNRWYNYPYTFLNNEPFSDEFKNTVRLLTHSKCEFGLIPAEMWDFSPDIQQEWIDESMQRLGDRSLIYGAMQSYHQMCRFFSGTFYRHPLLRKYEWYWRLEPDVEFYCDITYDPFVEMERNGKVYGFTVFLTELKESVQNFFRHTLAFKRRAGLPDTDLWPVVTRGAEWSNDLELMDGCKFNQCHFWSNFEIARLDLWDNDYYNAYFEYLDQAGGFWYERWGDAPVHTMGAAMFLNSSQIHYFRDIGYSHSKIGHCPGNSKHGQLPLPKYPEHADTENDAYWASFDSPRKNGVGCRCRCVKDVFVETERTPCFKNSYADLLGKTKSGRNEYH